MKKHPHIVNINDLESVTSSHGQKFESKRKRLSAAAGGKELGCSIYEIPPGKQAFPHHAHLGNEESFYIVSGRGECRIGDEKFEVSAGSYVACPAGEENAHSLRNIGAEPLVYLGISTSNETDIMLYPDSKKIAIAGGANMQQGLKTAKYYKVIKDQPSVEYYLDEE